MLGHVGTKGQHVFDEAFLFPKNAFITKNLSYVPIQVLNFKNTVNI